MIITKKGTKVIVTSRIEYLAYYPTFVDKEDYPEIINAGYENYEKEYQLVAFKEWSLIMDEFKKKIFEDYFDSVNEKGICYITKGGIMYFESVFIRLLEFGLEFRITGIDDKGLDGKLEIIEKVYFKFTEDKCDFEGIRLRIKERIKSFIISL